MKRALGLMTAAAGWVAAIQLLTGSMAPTPEFEVEGLTAVPDVVMVDTGRADKSTTSFVRPVITITTSTTTSTTVAPTTTTTTAVPRPRPTTTTTAAPATTTTTAAPATTTTTAAPATTTTTAASSGNFDSAAESDFISRINNLRVSEGLNKLSTSSSLRAYARNWSEEMATSGEFRHSDLQGYIATTNWNTLGENIGKGGSVKGIFDALVASSPHLANMLNEDFTHIGVGVYVDEDGTIWTTHIFGG